MNNKSTTYTEKQIELFTKFDKDVKKRSRILRLLLCLDQFFNVLLWNGSQDETISSHIQRRKDKGTVTKIECLICKILNKIESSHCRKSIGE